MKNKFNTLHKYIFDYSQNDYTKETQLELFSIVLKPLFDYQKADACVLVKLNSTENLTSVLTRLKFSEKQVIGFCSNLEDYNITNSQIEDIWGSTQFVVVLSQRYSAAFLWDDTIADDKNGFKGCSIFNSKIVTDIAKTIFENSTVSSKEILAKFNADRRENLMLNSAINSIINNLNTNNKEVLFEREEKKNLINADETLKTVEIISEKAKFIAHEIKNNLSIINLYSTILEKRLVNIELDEEIATSVSNAIKNIKNSSENVSSLISDLRCLSLPYIVETQIDGIISNVIMQSTEKANKAGVKLISGDILPNIIMTDKTKIQCVLLNVIYNAIEACKKDDEVKVYSDINNNEYNIYIENTGEMITEELKAKIFEADFTTKEYGNGLGLAICKKQLEQIKGDIELVSSDENKTVFLIKLSI